jgi:dTDP-4-dehydrorhamnose reductase
MLAHDFINNYNTLCEIIAFDKEELDITSFIILENTIKKHNLDIIINFAAYTNVEDAEDI